MTRGLISGTIYCLIVFAAGFALGTLRVLLVAPRIGADAAVLTELPIMLAAAYFICGQVVRRLHVAPDLAVRRAMVFWFLFWLLLLEILIGAMLFGWTITQQWSALATPVGFLGLSAQIFAALLPVFVGMGKER